MSKLNQEDSEIHADTKSLFELHQQTAYKRLSSFAQIYQQQLQIFSKSEEYLKIVGLRTNSASTKSIVLNEYIEK